jgi:copper chaperone CopZ
METTTTLTAPDIECDGCANAIKKALGTVPGVAQVEVDIDTKTVSVKHDPQTAPREALAARLDKAGFPVAA